MSRILLRSVNVDGYIEVSYQSRPSMASYIERQPDT